MYHFVFKKIIAELQHTSWCSAHDEVNALKMENEELKTQIKVLEEKLALMEEVPC